MPLQRRTCIQALLAATLPGLHLHAGANVGASEGGNVVDETWVDAARGREVPVRTRWPDAARYEGERPAVIYSHGLGGTVDGGAVWGEAWAAAGFVVLHLQHRGSDLDAVRAVTNSFTDQRALQSLANAEQFLARMGDVQFALDALARRQAARDGRWARVRPNQVGMSGHSFGAQTTLAMGGQRFPGYAGLTEPRLASFIAFSPAIPLQMEARRSFEAVDRPVLSITGTLDTDVVGVGNTAERRFAVFAALPAGRKAHLVLKDADHMSFAGQTGRAAEIIPRESVTRELQAAHHALLARVTTDWWLATLLDDADAHERLKRPAGLQASDLWERG
jgi:predicted dienelactone hydrolase